MSNTKEKPVCWEEHCYETEALLYFMLIGIPRVTPKPKWLQISLVSFFYNRVYFFFTLQYSLKDYNILKTLWLLLKLYVYRRIMVEITYSLFLSYFRLILYITTMRLEILNQIQDREKEYFFFSFIDI